MLKRTLAMAIILFSTELNAGAIGIDAPKRLGQASFSFLGAKLYSATLYCDRESFAWDADISLELVYSRSIKKSALIKATMIELKRMEGTRGDQSAIAQQLETCFANVGKGDSFVATATQNNQVRLYLNGSQSCTLKADNIKKRFLGIWLSDNSRSPALSKQLRVQ